jgi:hypothetical protein
MARPERTTNRIEQGIAYCFRKGEVTATIGIGYLLPTYV